MPLLYGLHDRESFSAVPSDGWCLDTVALSESPEPLDYHSIRPDINWLVRLNWGYGSTGTIPRLGNYLPFYEAAQRYIQGSRNVVGFIIGNEPNHEAERPDGQLIAPAHYAELFNQLRVRLTDAKLIVAAPAPYHANPVNWLGWYREMLALLQKPSGFAIHAYTRTDDPWDIADESERMGGILAPQYSGFLTYRDALSAIPPRFRNLPSYITEFNQIPDWTDKNSGIVKAAYNEIASWNRTATQTIHCLLLFRWKSYPGQRWGIENKSGVLADFSEASQNAQEAPDGVKDTKLVLPYIEAPKIESGPSGAFERIIDADAIDRGVSIVESSRATWKVKQIDWLDEQESQGRHHIYFDTLDESGNRLAGIRIRVVWPTGSTVVTSEAKPGEPWSANFPMSPSRNEFSAQVLDGDSEMVRGIGMGADTESGFNAGIHTSTVVIFQKVGAKTIPLPEGKPTTMPKRRHLVHPVQNPVYRTITRGFGEAPEDYERFGLLGHTGVDFATPLGSNIVAVDDGTVLESRMDEDGYGNYIKLKHIWGESLYAHLRTRILQPTETVKRGTVLGTSGNTGNSTGPHLHFAIRINPYNRANGWDGFSNPLPYLVSSKPKTSSVLAAIKQAASETGLEWQLLASLAWAESSFRPDIPGGGLFQLGSATWSDWASKAGASNISNPLDNSRVAAIYLKHLIDLVGGNLYKALTAYNFGIGNVLSGVQAPAITITYVNKVIHGRDLLKEIN